MECPAKERLTLQSLNWVISWRLVFGESYASSGARVVAPSRNHFLVEKYPAILWVLEW